ncbi:unnamed protein product [Thelazia callipaeda]|uniref:All-trans-retinol 13,14-reductase n=1 Tax=Thelazia callipaeda TaxID=103827 RepID=A0A0N5DBG1_THECL|nr:unnamed protein product [Thelazia callipaeda]
MICTGKSRDVSLSPKEVRDILRIKFDSSIAHEQWDVIVIGSGMSGLTVARVLTASGRKVLVLEQHERAGGACHTFELDKYEFDVGLHFVQDMYPGKELYHICSALSDSQIQWQKMDDPFDHIIIGQRSYHRNVGDSNNFRDQLKSWFPNEVENIDHYFRYVAKCLNINLWWLIAAKLMPLPFIRVISYFGCINFFTSLFTYLEMKLLDVMNSFKLSAEVKTVISYYFVNYGVPPNRASFLQHHLFYMESGYYPIGGASRLMASIVRSINKFGGKVVVQADVKQIIFADGKAVVGLDADCSLLQLHPFANLQYLGVAVKSGSSEYFVQAPLIVSTASIVKVFNEYIPRTIAQKSALFKVVNRIQSMEYAKVGVFQAYIGLDRTSEDLCLPSSNYFWSRNNDPYEFDRYLNLPLSSALEYGCPPQLYISFPSAKDPTWNERHPGVSTCQLISFISPRFFENFKVSSKKKTKKRSNLGDYTELKSQIGQMLVDQFLKIFPNLKSHMALVEFSTPLTQQYYMQNSHGEFYSLTQEVHRFRLEFWHELRCKTDLPGLYLSGQDVLFCGIGSAMHSGLITAGTILGRNLRKDLQEACRAQMLLMDKQK